MDIGSAQLTADVLEQIEILAAFGEVHYLKPHGALYNRVVHDETQAAAVIAALQSWRKPLPVLGLPGSAMLRLAAQAGLAVIPEGFADRAYTPDGRLRPRRETGAVIADAAQAARQAVALAHGGTVRTLCVHSDTPGAAALARAVRAALESAGFRLDAFA